LKTALAIEAMLKDPHKVVRSTAARKLVEITAKLVYENRVMLAQALLTRAANQEEDGIVRTTATVILKDINPHLRMRA